MKKNIIIVLAVVAFVLILILAFGGRREAPMPEPEEEVDVEVSETMDETGVVVVELFEQNNSGQFGIVSLEGVNGGTFVFIQVVSGPDDVPQPAHIHFNGCDEIGGVKYPLNHVENGESETLLDVPLDQIMRELPLAINVHKSIEELGVYVACGDILQ